MISPLEKLSPKLSSSVVCSSSMPLMLMKRKKNERETERKRERLFSQVCSRSSAISFPMTRGVDLVWTAANEDRIDFQLVSVHSNDKRSNWKRQRKRNFVDRMRNFVGTHSITNAFENISSIARSARRMTLSALFKPDYRKKMLIGAFDGILMIAEAQWRSAEYPSI